MVADFKSLSDDTLTFFLVVASMCCLSHSNWGFPGFHMASDFSTILCTFWLLFYENLDVIWIIYFSKQMLCLGSGCSFWLQFQRLFSFLPWKWYAAQPHWSSVQGTPGGCPNPSRAICRDKRNFCEPPAITGQQLEEGLQSHCACVSLCHCVEGRERQSSAMATAVSNLDCLLVAQWLSPVWDSLLGLCCHWGWRIDSPTGSG